MPSAMRQLHSRLRDDAAAAAALAADNAQAAAAAATTEQDKQGPFAWPSGQIAEAGGGAAHADGRMQEASVPQGVHGGGRGPLENAANGRDVHGDGEKPVGKGKAGSRGGASGSAVQQQLGALTPGSLLAAATAKPDAEPKRKQPDASNNPFTRKTKAAKQ